ncbi:MAG: hypothetical protein M0Q53_13755 [Prolixibacteraceae bacterium]|jgi:hypothetical protein|nr:hypothetical protein [Prolixibacteraceae bacterium]
MLKNILLLLFATFYCSFIVHAENVIDISSKKDGIIVLQGFHASPEGEQGIIYSASIKLPAFKRGNCMIRDKRKWPQTGNGMFGAVFGNSALPLVSKKSIMPGMKGVAHEATMLLLELPGNEYLCVLPLTSELSMGWLYLEDNGSFSVNSGTFGTAPVDGDIPVLAWSRSKDIYQAINNAWVKAFENKQIKKITNKRDDKNYPEVFTYLGWCSWEQYKKKIDDKLLLGTVDKINRSDIPIRWVLVDDGHQDASPDLMELVSFNPDPVKFPVGWQTLMAKRNEGNIKWFGLWHCFEGLWHNININNKLVGFENDLMPSRDGNALIVKDQLTSIDKFYKTMIETVKQQGFDFVKIDVQSSMVNEYEGHANPVQTSIQSSEALEKYCEKELNGKLINCMAQSPANMFAQKFSSVTRVSLDYQLGNKAKAVSHIHQSYMTTLFQGQSVWPDHDMFHSNDPVAGHIMAVSKAMSGGPVYLSDAADNFVPGHIYPLYYSDGKLLRPLAPAVPLPNSIFDDFLTDHNLYYVIAPLANQCAAIVAYNLNYPGDTTLEGKISPSDYRFAPAMVQPYPGQWASPDEGLVVYDWAAGKGQRFDQDYTFPLTGFSDKLLLVCPVKDGWAVVGRSDKFLSPSAVTDIKTSQTELKVTLAEGGPLVIWSKLGKPYLDGVDFVDIGNGFWKCQLPMNEKMLRIKR